MSFFRFKQRSSRVYGGIERIHERFRPSAPRWSRGQIIKAFFYGFLFCFVAATILVVWIGRDLPDPNKLADRQVPESTKIFDRTGQHLLYEVYQNQKRTIVDLAHISPFVPKAFVSVEDKYFYEHNGVRFTSILRAGFNNLIGRKNGSGGASTLTQQLIKNTIVGDQRSLFRKIKEAILAIQLEKKYSKDQIIQLYLNEIPLGSTNYGVEAASQSYFHKRAFDLDLAEAATLAAMNQAPTRYLNNPQNLRNRRDLVLGLMFAQGYITEAQKNEAQNSALRVYRNKGIFNAPHFVDYVREQLADQFGEQLIDTGGLKVITTLDFGKQQLAEKIVKEQGDKFAKSANANNAALVAVDPKTAQVLAMVGSRNYYDDAIDGQYNIAVKSRIRQPGSSFKPFVYLAAFEKGYTPDTVLYDVRTDFDARNGQIYSPQNYDHKEHGLITMRAALQNSFNIPAVKTMYLVGEQNTLDFAKRFGYSTFKGNEGLSLVLGGGGINLLEHTNAYATLADDGIYHVPVSILKVTNAAGTTLVAWEPNDGSEAVKPELAALISSVLSDNNARAMVFGIKNNLTLPNRAVAAKTGTTNDSKDAWTMGYVPSLAAGVWVGNTIPSPMKGGGNLLAGVIWNQFMRQSLVSTTPETFPTPPINDAVKPVLTGSDGGIKLRINTVTGKIAPPSMLDSLVMVKTYLPPHDILQYVIKDDPRGPLPPYPADDAQYSAWEKGLTDWTQRQQQAGITLVFEDPPTEYDVVQLSPELAPTLEVLSPTVGQVITERLLSFVVKAAAPRGIATVSYFIDDKAVGSSTQFPFGIEYTARQLATATHTLKVVAQDDQGNSTAKTVVFDFAAPPEPPNIDWLDNSPLTITSDVFPRVVNITPYRWNDIKTVAVYLESGATEKLIYTFVHPSDKLFNGQLVFTWQHSPGKGNYVLRAVMVDKNGQSEERRLEVIVQ